MFCLLSASSIEHRNEEGHAFVLGIDGDEKAMDRSCVFSDLARRVWRTRSTSGGDRRMRLGIMIWI